MAIMTMTVITIPMIMPRANTIIITTLKVSRTITTRV